MRCLFSKLPACVATSTRSGTAATTVADITVLLRHAITLVRLLSLPLLASGCVPFRVPLSPEASGRVIDANTQSPIVQAHVFFRDYPGSETTSDTNGGFSIPTIYRTHWLPPLPFDSLGHPGVLVVESPGYHTLVFDQAAQPEGTPVSGPGFELRLLRE